MSAKEDLYKKCGQKAQAHITNSARDKTQLWLLRIRYVYFWSLERKMIVALVSNV